MRRRYLLLLVAVGVVLFVVISIGLARVFGANGERMGGMMDKPDALPKSIWGYYFTVDGTDCSEPYVMRRGSINKVLPAGSAASASAAFA